MAIPYEGTKVQVINSIGKIQELLERVGFDSFGQTKAGDIWTLYGTYSGITFKWTANVAGIQTAYQDERSRYVADLSPDNANRMAWRAIYFAVEAQIKSILCGATEVGNEFSGLIVYPDGETVAEKLAASAEAGRLNSPDVLRLGQN